MKQTNSGQASSIPNAAPIVLFVFNRPSHTRQTLDALSANALADCSDLFVYADGARDAEELRQVEEVRDVVRCAQGFRSVTLIKRDGNVGLARNIIDGVTEVCARYGRAIVLEDDIVTSPHFLAFMNKALRAYEEEPRVWHVSGWNYPIDPTGLGDVFFWRAMNCWGWATWADRWAHFRRSPADLVARWDKTKIERFNLDGAHDFWAQVEANLSGSMNTWAVFWYATIFERNGLCLNPARSLVSNIGHDGSGQHCSTSDIFSSTGGSTIPASLPMIENESDVAVQRIRDFYRKMRVPLFSRILAGLKGILRRESSNT